MPLRLANVPVNLAFAFATLDQLLRRNGASISPQRDPTSPPVRRRASLLAATLRRTGQMAHATFCAESVIG
jgi:hypothetical protein